MACLRLAHRVLGLKREKLALGQLGGGGALAGLLYGAAPLALLGASHRHGAGASILEDDPRCANCGGIIAALAGAATRHAWMKRGLLPLAAAATISLFAAVAAPTDALAFCSTGAGLTTGGSAEICIGFNGAFPAVATGNDSIAIGTHANVGGAAGADGIAIGARAVHTLTEAYPALAK